MTKLKIRRIWLWFVGIIMDFIALVIIFISPITQYLVGKYNVQYTGREVKMDWAYVNPFTGYIHFDGLTIYESGSDSVFAGMEGSSVNFEIFKALGGSLRDFLTDFFSTQNQGISRHYRVQFQ